MEEWDIHGEPCLECLLSINSKDHAVKAINLIDTHPFRCVIILEKQACLYGDSIQGWLIRSWETGDSILQMIKCHFRDTNESRQAANTTMFVTWKVFLWMKLSEFDQNFHCMSILPHCGPNVQYDLHWAHRDQSMQVLSQWETKLHCNAISHWLGAYIKWSLSPHTVINPILLIVP